jgi:hypothetical protein
VGNIDYFFFVYLHPEPHAAARLATPDSPKNGSVASYGSIFSREKVVKTFALKNSTTRM